MKQIASHLKETIEKSMPLLTAISDTTASVKPGPAKWSPKEIMGHLIDSAANNHQKFIRSMLADGVRFPPYEQDYWVQIQHYNELEWFELLALWKAYNLHLAHIMEHIPAAQLSHSIFIGDSGPFSLEFIVKDYPEHLKHHLKAILPGTDFLRSDYKTMY